MGIFEPFRAIGYITTGGVPFSLQRLGTGTFVTVSVGKAFHVYNVSHHHPAFVSPARRRKLR
jgi:U3 small nucleolar RNA-associated protein 21